MQRFVSPPLRAAFRAGSLLTLTSIFLSFSGCKGTPVQPEPPGLEVTYGPRGVQRLAWHGQNLEDVDQSPEDIFHIWHMVATDLKGKRILKPEYVWGENNAGKTWDAVSKTWTYRFSWGVIRAKYEQKGDELDITVTEENKADSGIQLAGASVYPLVLHLQGAPPVAAVVDNVAAPGVTVQQFVDGAVTLATPSDRSKLYSGCEQSAAGKQPTCAVIVSSTIPDSLQRSASPERPNVMPGHSDTYTLSVHFTSSAVAGRLVDDAMPSWSAKWPPVLAWPDRRVIGTVYLASAPQKGSRQQVNNPRRYFATDSKADIDTQSTEGLRKFRERVLDTAKHVTEELAKLNAQGVITWDIEGQEYPENASYVCSPDQLATAAPEMDSVIDEPDSQYFGMKLSDAYFKSIRDAGFRVGVCVRPQHFVMSGNASAKQLFLSPADTEAELIRKMQSAHDRWGATLFYVDSTVDSNGRTLDASIIEQAAAMFPDSLIIPEESTPRMYRATAPFQTFLFHNEVGTSNAIRSIYPSAFSVNLINDSAPARLLKARQALESSVRRGDIMMVHADDWPPANDFVRELYLAAKTSHP